MSICGADLMHLTCKSTCSTKWTDKNSWTFVCVCVEVYNYCICTFRYLHMTHRGKDEGSVSWIISVILNYVMCFIIFSLSHLSSIRSINMLSLNFIFNINLFSVVLVRTPFLRSASHSLSLYLTLFLSRNALSLSHSIIISPARPNCVSFVSFLLNTLISVLKKFFL